MLERNLCLILWILSGTRGLLEDNFLIVFDNDKPNSLTQVSLDGGVFRTFTLDPDNLTFASDKIHKFPAFMTMRPDGKAVFIKHLASKKFVSIDWADGDVEETEFAVHSPFAASGLSMSLNTSFFYMSYHGRASVTKMDLTSLTNVSTKESPKDHGIEYNHDYLEPYAYDGYLWILASPTEGGRTILKKFSTERETFTVAGSFDREFNMIRIDWKDKKIYYVFLTEIKVSSLESPFPELFMVTERYVEDMVIGDQYIYFTLSMKEGVFRINKSTRVMEQMSTVAKIFKRPRNLAIYQKSILYP